MITLRYRKERYVARWQTLAGFHDAANPQAAVNFAIEQAKFNTPGSSWTVTDEATAQPIIIARGIS